MPQLCDDINANVIGLTKETLRPPVKYWCLFKPTFLCIFTSLLNSICNAKTSDLWQQCDMQLHTIPLFFKELTMYKTKLKHTQKIHDICKQINDIISACYKSLSSNSLDHFLYPSLPSIALHSVSSGCSRYWYSSWWT